MLRRGYRHARDTSNETLERQHSVPGASLTTLLFIVVIVACVYVGRDVLVPMALAILMSFVLAPPVDFLQRWYIPRSVAVIGVVLLACAGVFSLGGLMISQVNQLSQLQNSPVTIWIAAAHDSQ
jgi:predicted PurR-regulated permease PerM